MRKIKLKKGGVTIIDSEDFERFSKFEWRLSPNGYAVAITSIGRTVKYLALHREIFDKIPKSKEVDHINGDKLDNRKSNLRLCTKSENQRNKKAPKNNTSGYKGVYWLKNDKKWAASLKVNRKPIWLGSYKTKEEAYKAYCDGCIKYHKEFANIN